MRPLAVGACAVLLAALIITILAIAITYEVLWCVTAVSGVVIFINVGPPTLW
jgi:uncharacterized RDD family membrane protein YckC